MPAVVQRLAALASSLTAAELRVLLDLAVRAETSAAWTVTASSRDLSRTTGLVRASVQAALDSLHRQQIIESSGGSATQLSAHRLLCFSEEHQRSGLMVRPEVAQTPGQGGPNFEPDPNQFSTGYEVRLLERASARTESIDSEIDIEKLIDRLQKAQKGDFEESLFEQARQQIASHHTRYARKENRLPGLPDNAITAQFLAVADWPKLKALLADLAGERKEAGHSYGWYVTVALQRLHGISPEQARQIRARRKHSFTQEAKGTEVPRPTPLSVRAGADAPSARHLGVKGRFQKVQVEQLKHQIRAWGEARSL